MSSSSQLQGSGLTNNQAPSATLGGSAANLQSKSTVSALQQSATGEVAVIGEKVEPYRDTSYVNIVLLFVIAAAAIVGVVLWFRDEK